MRYPRGVRPRPTSLFEPLAVIALCAALISSTGCASSSRVVASDGSHRLVASDSGSGVTMVLTTESWAGDPAYATDFTIVHVLIANMGERPILLAPGDFDLRDSRGFHYSLYDAGGAFQAVLGTPASASLPGTELAYDPGASTDFERVRTDDGELGRLALPWGVLLPGTQMRGFLYFDSITASANHAQLVWRAQTPDHRKLSPIGFPLHVARSR